MLPPCASRPQHQRPRCGHRAAPLPGGQVAACWLPGRAIKPTWFVNTYAMRGHYSLALHLNVKAPRRAMAPSSAGPRCCPLGSRVGSGAFKVISRGLAPWVEMKSSCQYPPRPFTGGHSSPLGGLLVHRRTKPASRRQAEERDRWSGRGGCSGRHRAAQSCVRRERLLSLSEAGARGHPVSMAPRQHTVVV